MGAANVHLMTGAMEIRRIETWEGWRMEGCTNSLDEVCLDVVDMESLMDEEDMMEVEGGMEGEDNHKEMDIHWNSRYYHRLIQITLLIQWRL